MPGPYCEPMRTSKLAAVVVTALLWSGCGGSEADGPASSADPTSTEAASADELLRQGRSLYGATCSVCHGNRGQGGVGPSLALVAETWPVCADQVEWISLGSEGWRTAHGDTYGATGKPLAGGMPAQSQLTLEETRLVAAFERVEYGGVDAEQALADCGVG